MKSLKRISLGALLALVSTSVFAADYTASLSVKDISGTPGGTGTIDIVLANTDPEVTIIQFNLTVPEGVTPSVKNSEIEKLRNIATASAKLQDDGSYKYLFETEDEETLVDVNEEGSVVVSIPVKFSEGFAGGEGKLTNIVIAGAKGHKDPSLVVSFNFTVGAETEKITLTKEYNTYIPAKALDFSSVEGIKAYYVTAVTATEATITETTTVAAGEGIILKGTAGDYEVPVATAEVAPSEENLLKTSGIAVNDYILYDGKFVLCSDGELADGKAYLPASAFTAGAKIINIVFGGESTGINEVQKSEADGAIYNLSGMRVSKTQKGVYIMNGRKVIVK
jgi:hypothetical protein